MNIFYIIAALLIGLSFGLYFFGNRENISETKKSFVASFTPESKWPAAAPIDKTDPHWEINNNLNINGTTYKKAEVSPGKWQWVENKEVMDIIEKEENHRRLLWHALKTRPLNKKEMIEVAQYGTMLNVEMNQSFSAQDKASELQAALLSQQILQQQANR